MALLTEVVEKAMIEVGLVAAQAAVNMVELHIGGDFNLRNDHMEILMNDLQMDDHFDEMHTNFVELDDLLPQQIEKERYERDFIITNMRGTIVTRDLPIAHDQQHRALGLVLDTSVPTPFQPEFVSEPHIRNQRKLVAQMGLVSGTCGIAP